MERVSYPHFVCENYIEIIDECPARSSRHPPPNAAAASPPSRFHVQFTFSCESHYTEWVQSEDSHPHILSQYSYPEADKSVVLILQQFLTNPIEIMAWELRELPLTDAQRERLILFALERARRDVAMVPSWNNVLNLHLRVHVVHSHMITGGGDSVMSRVMQESFDAAVRKVPAAETAVEMVMREKVELSETETCTICLEEMREAVRMPCLHVFHGGCIGEWLRIDHRCPLCRFQIPAAM